MAELDDISSEELFNSALSDLPEATEEVTEGEPQGDTRDRDEQGRFVAKTEEPAPKPEAEQVKPVEAKEEAQVPSWRLRELREAREAAERRATDLERRLLALQPRPEPAAKPDMFEKPDEFVRMNVQEALNPVQREIASVKEFFSRQYAIDKHGEETVAQAYQALDRLANAGDPQALAVVQSVKQSMNPFMEMVAWHRGTEASRDPEGFFQRKLEEALKDEKFKGELLTKLQPPAEEKPGSVIKLPPSIGRVAAARSASDELGDMSDASLFQHAMR